MYKQRPQITHFLPWHVWKRLDCHKNYNTVLGFTFGGGRCHFTHLHIQTLHPWPPFCPHCLSTVPLIWHLQWGHTSGQLPWMITTSHWAKTYMCQNMKNGCHLFKKNQLSPVAWGTSVGHFGEDRSFAPRLPLHLGSILKPLCVGTKSFNDDRWPEMETGSDWDEECYDWSLCGVDWKKCSSQSGLDPTMLSGSSEVCLVQNDYLKCHIVW